MRTVSGIALGWILVMVTMSVPVVGVVGVALVTESGEALALRQRSSRDFPLPGVPTHRIILIRRNSQDVRNP